MKSTKLNVVNKKRKIYKSTKEEQGVDLLAGKHVKWDELYVFFILMYIKCQIQIQGSKPTVNSIWTWEKHK